LGQDVPLAQACVVGIRCICLPLLSDGMGVRILPERKQGCLRLGASRSDYMTMPQTVRPGVEVLESRDVPSAVQAFVNGGNLYVIGTPQTDFLLLSDTNHRLSLTGIPISVNGARVNSIDDTSVTKVLIYGSGGNDYIDLSTVKLDAAIYTGVGNDWIRCGTGHDTVSTGAGFDQIFRPFTPGQPAPNGASVTDVRQGQNPLCQTDAALAEIVNEGYNPSASIQYLGYNVYDVKPSSNTPDQRVYFDGWTTPNDPVETNGEIWPILLQRARLQSLGIDPTVPHTGAQWAQLNQQTNGKLYSLNDALTYFTGKTANYQTVGSISPQAMQASLASGAYILAASQTYTYVSYDGIIGNHVYAVLAVYNDNGTWKVRLYNPWGTDRENGTTIDSADRSHPPANDGIITLTWSQFINNANFKGTVVARK
jgi:hypothetical protein